MTTYRTAAVLLLACCLLAGPTTASAAKPRMYVGAAEDASKSLDPLVAQAKMTLARLAGFNAIRLTAIWSPGQTSPNPTDLLALQNAANAAELNGIRIILSVYQWGSKTTPITSQARSEFAQFTASIARSAPSIKDFIIGNEPNLNRFWMPQFHPNGASASPAAYMGLLAETYDALKAVSPTIEVIGGSVSPRGSDNYRSKRHTHSPTIFIPAMGRAYKALKRNRPVMDSFAFHPYGDNSSQPPEFRHPRTTTIGLSDYGKLVKLLGNAFDGTAQAGSRLPIVYDEYGVDTAIPGGKTAVYAGREPATTKPVSEAVQAAYYRRALKIASCQPTVKGFLIFHVTDEPDLDRWQSGVYYADDTPKASFALVKHAIEQVRAGTIGRCARR